MRSCVQVWVYVHEYFARLFRDCGSGGQRWWAMGCQVQYHPAVKGTRRRGLWGPSWWNLSIGDGEGLLHESGLGRSGPSWVL